MCIRDSCDDEQQTIRRAKLGTEEELKVQEVTSLYKKRWHGSATVSLSKAHAHTTKVKKEKAAAKTNPLFSQLHLCRETPGMLIYCLLRCRGTIFSNNQRIPFYYGLPWLFPKKETFS